MSMRYDRGGLRDVDVPVVDAAVDLDVADVPLGGGGRVLAGDVHQAEDRLGGVPLLAQGGLGPGQGGPAQLPVGVQPVRVADHGDDPVLDAGVIEGPGRRRPSGPGGDGGAAPRPTAGRLRRAAGGSRRRRPCSVPFFERRTAGRDNARIN